MDKKENNFTVFLIIFWKLVVLTPFPADAVFGDFRASSANSMPFPFRQFVDRSRWNFLKPYINLHKSTYKELLKPINRPKTAHLRAFRRVYVISGRLVKDDSRFVSISTNTNSTIDTRSSKMNAWIQDRDARRFCNSILHIRKFSSMFRGLPDPGWPRTFLHLHSVIDEVAGRRVGNTREECRLL